MDGDERDIPEGWTLTPADLTLVMAKGRANRLGFAVLLLFYRAHGRFPGAPTEIEPQAVDQVARQIGMGATPHDGLDLAARTWKRHRAEIRALFGYREATVADAEALEDWLRDQAAVVGAVPDHLVARLEARCRELAIEPPSADRVDRIVRAAIRAHEERLYARIRDRLTPETRARLEALLQPASDAEERFGRRRTARERPPRSFCGCVAIRVGRASPASRPSWPGWSWSAGSGCPPTCSTRCFPTNWSGIDGVSRSRPPMSCADTRKRRGSPGSRPSCIFAAAQLTDDLVDLLIETIHQIGARAERRVDRELLDDLKRVDRQAEPPVRARRGRPRPTRWDRARGRVPGRRRTDLARPGQGMRRPRGRPIGPPCAP